MKRLIAIAALAVFVSAPASANIIFNLSGVTLNDNTAVTGSITTSDDLATLVGFNISVAAGGTFPHTVPDYTFDNTSIFTSQLPHNSWINLGSNGNYFQISFGELTSSGATITTNAGSWVQQAGITRTFISGALVAAPVVDPTPAPEPASWTLALAGLGLIGAAFIRRRAAAAA